MKLTYCYMEGSALDHIELTSMTVFAIPEFKSLEVLKIFFYDNIIVYQPQH